MTYIIVGIIIIIALALLALCRSASRGDDYLGLDDLDCTDMSDMTYREESKK